MDYSAHLNHKLTVYHAGMALSNCDNLLISAGSLKRRFRDDTQYAFHVNPYFKEFLPMLERPDSFILLSPGATPVLLIRVRDDYWHSEAALPQSQYLHHFQLREYSTDQQLRHLLPQGLSLLAEENPGLNIADDNINPHQLLSYIDFHRAEKSHYEIDCVSRANRLAVKGHRAAAAAFEQGLSEIEIHLGYLQATGQLEAQMPYSNIVGINEHAAVLHHTVLNNQRVTPRSMLIDAGADYNGYAADITRTYAAKNAHPLFIQLINGVEKLQLELIEQLTVGEKYTHYHLLTHRAVSQLLCDLGLLCCSPQQAQTQLLSRFFFPHGLGHLLGLQVHDRGGYSQSADGAQLLPPEEHSALRCTREITENMLLTIEPGVYFIPLLLEQLRQQAGDAVNWDKVAQLQPYGGVRIEDNVVITAQGTRNLTREAFNDHGG